MVLSDNLVRCANVGGGAGALERRIFVALVSIPVGINDSVGLDFLCFDGQFREGGGIIEYIPIHYLYSVKDGDLGHQVIWMDACRQ